MGLPWFRMDSNFGQHDKILDLLADPSPLRWQAAFSWAAAIGWSNGAGTDGKVTKNALRSVHGTPKTARLLEKYRLWREVPGGWVIVNFEKKNQLNEVRDAISGVRRASSDKANCVRWHGKECWTDGRCTRMEAG